MRVAKTAPELLNHFVKSSTVAYKRVAYKKNLEYGYKLHFLFFASESFYSNFSCKVFSFVII